MPQAAAPAITIAAIQQATSAHYHLPIAEMSSQRVDRRVARPRQVAMYLCSQLTPFTLAVIGRHFGDRDRTTVLYAIRTIETLSVSDPQIDAAVESLRARLVDPDRPLSPPHAAE